MHKLIVQLARLALGALLFGLPGMVLGQNCPADLEWPATAQAAPATTNAAAVVAWPQSMETQTVITDRHPKARVTLATPKSSVPALGETICDPTFGTAFTRVTPPGYSLFSIDPFSANGGWVLAVAPAGGAISAFALDPNTGKPVMVNGKPRQIPISFQMLPESTNGSICPLTSAAWSTKTEGVLFIVGCGTRIFKYDLALYNPAAPRAGLMAGNNARSVAKWPNCPPGCRQGPVFMDFTDLFSAHSNDGLLGSVTTSISEDETTFSGMFTRQDGYKNVKGIFVYRPWNNSLWYAAGLSTTPDTPFLLAAKYQNKPINKRFIGAGADRTGRYFSLAVCSDPTYDLGGCGSSTTYVMDLNATPQGATLGTATLTGVDQISHGTASYGLRIGANPYTQALAVQYFSGTPEKKVLNLPYLGISDGGWWGNYTSASRAAGPMGAPLAALLSTFSYNAIASNPTDLSACPTQACLYANEMILFNVSGTRFIRIGHNRSYVPDFNNDTYWDLPQAKLSPNGKLALVVSNWGQPTTSKGAGYAVYAVRLPAAWKMLLDDRLTVNAAAPSVAPNAWTDLRVSHVPTVTGMNVLLQLASQPAAIRSTACQFQVTSAKNIQLANDSGVFSNRFSGPLGSPSAGFLENSRCKIDLVNSTVDATTHGNIIYSLRVLYKTPFAGKTIRAVAQALGTSTWTDGTRFNIAGSGALSWNGVSLPAAESASERESLPETAFWQYATEPLAPGSVFEFALEDPQPFQLQLTSNPPGLFASAPADSHLTVRVVSGSEGDPHPQFEVLEDSGTRRLAVSPEVTAGSMVRLDYRNNGTVVVSLNGKQVAQGYVPANGAGLFVVTNRVHPEARIVRSEQ
jgi:hypothetical protein